MAMVNLINSF